MVARPIRAMFRHAKHQSNVRTGDFWFAGGYLPFTCAVQRRFRACRFHLSTQLVVDLWMKLAGRLGAVRIVCFLFTKCECNSSPFFATGRAERERVISIGQPMQSLSWRARSLEEGATCPPTHRCSFPPIKARPHRWLFRTRLNHWLARLRPLGSRVPDFYSVVFRLRQLRHHGRNLTCIASLRSGPLPHAARNSHSDPQFVALAPRPSFKFVATTTNGGDINWSATAASGGAANAGTNYTASSALAQSAWCYPDSLSSLDWRSQVAQYSLYLPTGGNLSVQFGITRTTAWLPGAFQPFGRLCQLKRIGRRRSKGNQRPGCGLGCCFNGWTTNGIFLGCSDFAVEKLQTEANS